MAIETTRKLLFSMVIIVSMSACADDKETQERADWCDHLFMMDDENHHPYIFERMQRDMDRWFDSHRSLMDHTFSSAKEGKWFPSSDVQHKDREMIITVDLPGVDMKDIDLRVNNGILVIKGERKDEQKIVRKEYHRLERSHGEFYRSYVLPANVDVEKIKARMKDGVLEIRIPKTAESVGNKITIEE